MSDKKASHPVSDRLAVGQIVGVFGVKGWVKVKSFTDPAENIRHYKPWWLKTRYGLKCVEIDDAQMRPQGLVVHIVDCDDRDAALALSKSVIEVDRNLLPSLPDDEYYWHELVGMSVFAASNAAQSDSGQKEFGVQIDFQAIDAQVLDAQAIDSKMAGPEVAESEGVLSTGMKNLGRVAALLETGANDVLVVRASEDSIDDRERLIPYVPGQFVLNVDKALGQITVDWDVEF